MWRNLFPGQVPRRYPDPQRIRPPEGIFQKFSGTWSEIHIYGLWLGTPPVGLQIKKQPTSALKIRNASNSNGSVSIRMMNTSRKEATSQSNVVHLASSAAEALAFATYVASNGFSRFRGARVRCIVVSSIAGETAAGCVGTVRDINKEEIKRGRRERERFWRVDNSPPPNFGPNFGDGHLSDNPPQNFDVQRGLGAPLEGGGPEPPCSLPPPQPPTVPGFSKKNLRKKSQYF